MPLAELGVLQEKARDLAAVVSGGEDGAREDIPHL